MRKEHVEGKAKELQGRLTGDESREAEGRIQQKAGDAKDAPEEMWEDLKDKAGEAYNEREERKQKETSR